MQISERTWSPSDSSGYRFGYQGQEKIDEIQGVGNSIDYKFRMYNSKIGRFFATDPLEVYSPFYTPYQFSGNRPIDMIELEGLEPAKPPQEGSEDEFVTANYRGVDDYLRDILDDEDVGQEMNWIWNGNQWLHLTTTIEMQDGI